MAPNPNGSRDERATALVIESEGSPALVLWSWACHPVGRPQPRRVASHFAHTVRTRLRRDLGETHLPVLFLQGFSGDTRPSATTVWRRPRDVALWLRWGRGFYDMNQRAYGRWSTGIASHLSKMVRCAPEVEVDQLVGRRIARVRGDFVTGGPDGDHRVHFQTLAIGDHVRIVGVSAELVTEFGHWTRSQLPHVPFVLCVGCLDNSFGYIPTDGMIRAGGYEGGEYCHAFGYDRIRPDAGSKAFAALSDLLNL